MMRIMYLRCLQKEQGVFVSTQLLNAAFSIHGFREERFYLKVCFTQYKKYIYTSSSTFYLYAYKPNQYLILDRD